MFPDLRFYKQFISFLEKAESFYKLFVDVNVEEKRIIIIKDINLFERWIADYFKRYQHYLNYSQEKQHNIPCVRWLICENRHHRDALNWQSVILGGCQDWVFHVRTVTMHCQLKTNWIMNTKEFVDLISRLKKEGCAGLNASCQDYEHALIIENNYKICKCE